MALSCVSLLYVHLLVAIVTADRRFQDRGIRRQRAIPEDSSLLQPDELKPQTNPRFARKLNDIGSMFELVSLLASRDRRFCTNKTITNIQEAGVNISEDNSEQSTIKIEEFITNLKTQCAETEDKRRVHVTVPEKSLTVLDIKRMNEARLEAKTVACKPKRTFVELPDAPFGYTYYPNCVATQRCSGCCTSSHLECTPVKVVTVKKWVIQMNIMTTHSKPVLLPVKKHKKCKCGCKVLESHCNAAQIYDEDSCRCKCSPESEEEDCGEQKKWDPTLCKCVCKGSPFCTTGAS